jgi:uncharacterized membrane protein YcjF (UPF0283 family)
MDPCSDDDRAPGRPIQAPRPVISPSPATPAIEACAGAEGHANAETLPRPDEGAGRPKQVPHEASHLTEADYQRIERERIREAAEDARTAEEVLASDPAILHVPAFLLHPLVLAALVGLAALFGLFLFAQVTATLTSLASLPAWMQYTGWGVLSLLAAAVLFAMGRLAVFYFGLQPNRPVRLHSLNQLSERTRLRWLVHKKKAEAKDQLEGYLRTYPLEIGKNAAALAALGLGEEKLHQLQATRTVLLDANRFANIADWFGDFQTSFQAPLDTAAAGRVNCFARRVAVMTAVSPNTLIDTLLTTYCGLMMLADLCRIYNLRVGRLGTAVLLARVFFNSYVAGQLNEFESVTSVGLEHLVGRSGLHFGSLGLDAFAGKAIGQAGARIGSGALNYLMLQRLGRYACRLLRPVHAE